MGNVVSCTEPKKQPGKRPAPKKHAQQQQKVEKVIESTWQPQVLKASQQTTTAKVSVRQDQFNCLIHNDEPIKAVCLTESCQHTGNRTLCCECLIEGTCESKVRLGEFVAKLRNNLSKDAQDVFMELFDDKNQVKIDLMRQIVNVMDNVANKLKAIQEKNVQPLIISYYLQKLSTSLTKPIVRNLDLIIDGRVAETSPETLDFALMLMTNRGMTEQMCEDIEKKKTLITEFATDFTTKFQTLLQRYTEALKFLFNLLITPMEFLMDDEGKPQQMQKRQQAPVQKESVTEIKKAVSATPSSKANANTAVNDKCNIHNQEILAICIKEKCEHKDRKMCADCLIDTKCNERMKLNEFSGRMSRILNKEIIDQLCMPWEDTSIGKGLNLLFTNSIEIIKDTLQELQTTIVNVMFVKYHLIEEATPKDLKGQFTKEYFEAFMSMIQTGKVSSNNQSVPLGVKFVNSRQTIENLLGAIVKTEQILPKKSDKLQHKLISVTQLFLDRTQLMIDLYRQHNDPEYIHKQFQLINVESFSLEESIYKIKSNYIYYEDDGKSLTSWDSQQTFNLEKAIVDICFINETFIAVALIDGVIVVYNLITKKQQMTLKHGMFITSLRAFQFNSQSVLVSSGFQPGNLGHTIIVWDIKLGKPAHVQQSAHNNSIRKLKYLNVNPAIASTFYNHNNSTAAQLSSQASNVGSQNSIFLDIDEQLISCSDDGTIKLWKLDKNLKLFEDVILKQGMVALDFTLLNGCILVSSHPDKTVQIVIYIKVIQSLPFQSQSPFQQLTDDSPVYAISPIDPLQSKKKLSTQQKFITGNEKGSAKIYEWQNGRAVIMKILNIHEDKINKISMQQLLQIRLQPGFIGSVSQDKGIALTLIQQAKVLTRLHKHEQPIVSFAYLKAAGFLISADVGGTVIIWK